MFLVMDDLTTSMESKIQLQGKTLFETVSLNPLDSTCINQQSVKIVGDKTRTEMKMNAISIVDGSVLQETTVNIARILSDLELGYKEHWKDGKISCMPNYQVVGSFFVRDNYYYSNNCQYSQYCFIDILSLIDFNYKGTINVVLESHSFSTKEGRPECGAATKK